MSISKSCIRCSTPLPADSVAELCKACTSDARASETPANQQPASTDATISRAPRSPSDSTVSRDDNDGILGMPTDVAAAHGFPTDEAGTKGRPSPVPVAPTVKPFPVVSRYQILDRLGEGGAGEVFLARQIATSRDVAIKVLNSPRTSDRQRFDREALHLGKLNHPAIVNVHEVGDSDRGPYICMELMPGGSLAGRLKEEGPLPEKEAARLMELIARGLAVVHDADILHRDLKPGNILLDKQGLPKIADFGLAKSTVIDAAHSLDGITQPGIMGTPAYMALEQAEARHGDVNKLTDVYGLGAILYHMLTGKPPHGGKTAWDIINKVLKERPRDPSALRPGLDATLEAICLKCLEKQPENRYQSALEFADDLARWQHGDSTIARPASRTQKLVRWLGRQKRVAAVAVLVIAAAVTINLAGMWLKPRAEVAAAEDPVEAERKKILAEIETLAPVVLIGETGRPRYHEKTDETIVFRTSTYGDDPCTIESVGNLAISLLGKDDVPSSFRFQADVRHEDIISDGSKVGLFFGSWEEKISQATLQEYTQYISFNDFPDPRLTAIKQFQNTTRYQSQIAKKNLGELSWSNPINHSQMKINSPPAATARPFRHFDITVQNERVYVAGGASDPAFGPEKPTTFKSIKDRYLLNSLEAANTLKNSSPRQVCEGRLGIMVSKGIGSFKNVTIQKLNQ